MTLEGAAESAQGVSFLPCFYGSMEPGETAGDRQESGTASSLAEKRGRDAKIRVFLQPLQSLPD